MARSALFEFQCPSCDEVHERYVGVGQNNSVCACGELAFRIISAPRDLKINGHSVRLDTDQWAKSRIQRAKVIRENNGK